MHFLDGFRGLAAEFGGFILDLWGVVHDGVQPYPGAQTCLRALRDMGKPVILLSNAPRRNAAAQAAMRRMGLADDLYTGILTSGEITHTKLRDRDDPFFASLGRKLYHLGPERDRNVFAGLDYDAVERPALADFVLNTGPDDERDPTDINAFEGELQACLAAGLPMISANPDLDVIRGGTRVLCAGALAMRYETLGGAARSIGKPHAEAFAGALALLGVPASRALMVGDSLRTDIAGAAASGIPSCWVLGGIHAEALGGDWSRAGQAALAEGLAPYAAIPAFDW